MSTPLFRLVQALRRAFSAGLDQGGAVAAETRRVLAFLERASVDGSPLAGTGHPSTPVLDRFLATRADLLEGTLAPILHDLPWRYGYAPRADAPGLETRMAWAELVGPAAPIHSDEVGFGLTFIGPNSHYLAHRHPAVELYAVIAGEARWTEASETRTRRPGAFILHPSDLVHAMETERHPLLAIYSWTGDIVSPSVWQTP